MFPLRRLSGFLRKHAPKLVFLLACACVFSLLLVHLNDYRKAQIGSTAYRAAAERIRLEPGTPAEYPLESPSFPFRTPQVTALELPLGVSAASGQDSILIELLADGSVMGSWQLTPADLEDAVYRQLPLESPFFSDGHALSVRLTSSGAIDCFTCAEGLCCRLICSLSLTSRIPFLAALAGCLLFFGLIAVLLCRRTDERIVMALVLVAFGIAYLLSCPNASGPDEPGHFYRAYEIANGSMVSRRLEGGYSGNLLPSALARPNDPDAVIDPQELTEFSFSNLALYAPVNYLPQAISIRAAMFFTDHVSALYMASRIGCLIFCLVLFMASLWIIPFGRRALFLAMLLPMTQQIIASPSADAPTAALAFFFTAMLLHMAYGEPRNRKACRILLAAAAIMLSLCKIVYVALLPMLFLLPLKAERQQKKEWIRCFVLLGVCALLNLIWLSISSTYLVRLSGTADSAGQVMGILRDPIGFIEVILRTINSNTADYLSQLFGASLGTMSITTAPVIWIVMLCMLLYESCRPAPAVRCGALDIPLLLGSVLLACLLIFTSLYVQWTNLGAGDIAGIQGRYFIPLLPALIAVFQLTRRGSAGTHPTSMSMTLFTAAVLNGIAIFNLCNAYSLI